MYLYFYNKLIVSQKQIEVQNFFQTLLKFSFNNEKKVKN